MNYEKEKKENLNQQSEEQIHYEPVIMFVSQYFVQQHHTKSEL